MLQQQQVQFQTQSPQRQITQQHASGQISAHQTPQQTSKLQNITSQSFDLYGVQDPTFMVTKTPERIYTQQQQQQQQQQLQSFAEHSAHIEQSQPTFHTLQQETSRANTHPTFENTSTHPMMEYLEANQDKRLDNNQTQWSNQQFLSLNSNQLVEDESLSSNNSTPNQSSSTAKIKRPMNAFLIYSIKRRRELSAENPTLTTSEISTILGDEWAKMDSTLKNTYILQAQALKNSFDSEHPDYVYSRRPNNTRKKKKSGNAESPFPNGGSPMSPYNMYYPYYPPLPVNYQLAPIKQPPNAFLIFNRNIRQKIKNENPDMSVSEISKRVSDAWKALPEEQKNKYYEEAKSLRKDFSNIKRLSRDKKGRNMAPTPFNLPMANSAQSSTSSDGSTNMNYLFPTNLGMLPFPMGPIQKKRVRTPKDPTQPKHPSSAFIFFLREVRPQFTAKNPKSDLGTISKMVSAAWKELSPEEKAKYVQKSEEDKKRYTIEMEMWMEANKQKNNKADGTGSNANQ